jgi:hypothetical protein
MNSININMNARELNSLLEKYYSGESTEEEERMLREYFNEDSVLPGFEAEKEIFAYYKSGREIPGPSHDFETRILAGIDSSDNKGKSRDTRRILLPLLGAAASVLILAGSYFFLVQRMEPKDTFTDPKLAYAETMKILLDVSSKMNRATLALEPVGRMNEMTAKSFVSISKSTVLIEKGLKNLDYLKKMDNEK